MKVIIISGFLGSGKSELVKIILENDDVLIENEIADFGIDGKNLKCKKIIEINGGSISNINLNIFRKVLKNLDCKRVIIETSGVAKIENVISVVNEFNILPYVISIIDAEKFEKCEKLSSNTLQNLSLSSSLILNKIDLVKSPQLLVKKLKHFNNNVFSSVRCNIDINKLLTNKIKVESKNYNFLPYIFWRIKNNLGLMNKEEIHENINAYTFERYGDFNLNKLETYLVKNKIMRGKGFVNHKNKRYMFSFSNGQLKVQQIEKKEDINRVVIIDNNIFSKRAKVRNSLNKCIKKTLKDKLKDFLYLWKNQQRVVQIIIT